MLHLTKVPLQKLNTPLPQLHFQNQKLNPQLPQVHFKKSNTMLPLQKCNPQVLLKTHWKLQVPLQKCNPQVLLKTP
mgnify:FL=1